MAQALIGGTVLGLVLLGIETGFDFPIHRLVAGPDPKFLDLIESKRSVDALPLLVWPAALCLERLGRPWLGLGLAVIWTAASFRLTAASATLGMALSLAVFGLAYWSLPIARKALAAATLLAFILIIPVADTAYSLGPTPETCRFKFSACHRFEIWHFAAEKTLDRPLVGHGINSSRFVPNDGAVSAFQPDPAKPMIPLHPHDAFLQIWLELGAVGRGAGRRPAAVGAAGDQSLGGRPSRRICACRICRGDDSGWPRLRNLADLVDGDFGFGLSGVGRCRAAGG